MKPPLFSRFACRNKIKALLLQKQKMCNVMLSRVFLKGIYKAAAVMLMALTGAAFASALDLPTKKVKGCFQIIYSNAIKC